MARDWDTWLGDLALSGVDPRGWDLHQLLAAFEAALRRGSKDEQAWNRTRTEIYAEPDFVKRERRAATSRGEQPQRGRMSVSDAEAMLSRMALADSIFG